jgi:hypothetical protein
VKGPDGATLDAALLEALGAEWEPADQIASRACQAHPELRRHLDAQRAGRRLRTLRDAGKAEGCLHDGGFYSEWRAAR